MTSYKQNRERTIAAVSNLDLLDRTSAVCNYPMHILSHIASLQTECSRSPLIGPRALWAGLCELEVFPELLQPNVKLGELFSCGGVCLFMATLLLRVLWPRLRVREFSETELLMPLTRTESSVGEKKDQLL